MQRCEHRDDPDPRGRATLGLAAEELFLVGVLRAWTAAQRTGGESEPTWCAIFALAELPADTGAAFGHFMSAVARTMRRPLDIRCRPCPQVGADEEAMLRIVSSVQAKDRLSAIDDLAGWVVPEGITRALRAAQRFGTLLSRHEIVLSPSTLAPPSTWTDRGYGTGPH